MIERYSNSGDLHLISVNNKIIGYSLISKNDIDIFEIKYEFRGKGAGRYFVNYLLNRYRRQKAIGIHVECLCDSEAFWELMGFVHDCSQAYNEGDPNHTENPHRYILFTRDNKQALVRSKNVLQLELYSEYPARRICLFESTLSKQKAVYLLNNEFVTYCSEFDVYMKARINEKEIFDNKPHRLEKFGVECQKNFIRLSKIKIE